MPSEVIDCEVLDDLLDELDIKARDQHAGERSEEYWACQRRHPRHPFRVGCKARFLMPGSMALSMLPGHTRNLSRNGLGLLVRRVFVFGEPIEVEVLPPGRPPMFMAGVVRFCRYAGRGFHEIGVQLKAASAEPIISKGCTVPAEVIIWLSDAEQQAGQNAQTQRSAHFGPRFQLMDAAPHVPSKRT